MRNNIQNIEDKKLGSNRNRRIIFMTVVLVLTFAFLILFGWNAWSLYGKTKTASDYRLTIEKLRGIIIHLDEVLTMSARMAVLTDNLKWEERYRSYELELDAAIKEAVSLGSKAPVGKGASDIDTANIKLVEMENRSFDLVRQGRSNEAKALLFSDEYEEHKRNYAQGMANLKAGLSVAASTSLKDEQWKAVLSIGIAFLLILFLITIWFVAFQIVNRWGQALISNEDLERRIEARTKELSQTQAQLFQTSKLATLGEMSAGLAHEMNQPLGGISLVAKHMRKLMERGRLSEGEIDSALTDIDASVKRMSKVIQHIRTFARQDAFNFSEVDVNETIDSALSLLGEQLRLHEIEVVRELNTDLPEIMGEPYQLEQVWINMISNARDALDEKGRRISQGKEEVFRKHLRITASYDSKCEIPCVEVRFDDNGVGLVEGQIKKIFEPFFTTKEVGKAMGLGLSISHGIIESHQGRIEVEGKVNEGATFRVILPVGGNHD